MERYLKPTEVINCDSPSIQETSSTVTQGCVDDIEKARSLFYFVRDRIRYNIYVKRTLPEHFMASNTLSRKEGYCVQKAVLLAALARAADIPAGLGFAKIRNNLLPQKTVSVLGTNVLPFHGYTELYLNGKWVKATPAFNIELCEKNRIIPVGFDGEHDAVFHRFNRNGKLHIEYLEDLGRQYDDLPLEKLHEAQMKAFGKIDIDPPER
jgi:transglutaminase-like putative cysteine protease